MDPQVTMVVSILSHGRNEFDDCAYPHGLDMSGKYHKPVFWEYQQEKWEESRSKQTQLAGIDW